MARLKQISTEQLAQEAQSVIRDLTVPQHGLHLQRTPFDNSYIQLLWRQHYVGSKGTVGRQLHYIVYWNGVAVGAISAGSAMFAHKKRDKILAIGRDEQKGGIRHVANNTMFRMTRPKDERPLATEVLAKWMEIIREDWLEDYGDYVRAFETLVEPPRWGGIYKLQKWRKIGLTYGLGARRPEGHGTAGENSTGRRKIIKVPKKIVWIYPICSYEEAVKRSLATRKSSYGEDANKIQAFLSQTGRACTLEQIVLGSGVCFERTKTLLYLMRTSDGVVKRHDDDTYSLEKFPVGSVYSQPKCKRDTQQSLNL